MTYRHLVDEIAPVGGGWKRGVHWLNEGTDPRAAVDRWKRGELSLQSAARPYVSRHVFATFAADDPRPTLTGLSTRARRRLRSR
jgi:hypothetical protein